MKWLIICIAIVISGCANYTATTRSAREEFYAGKYTDAAKQLEKGAHEPGVDQLLYLLDRATALHHAGEFADSNKEFHLADRLAEIKDYTSLASEAATLVSNDKIIDYKGEDFENILISQYLALNYLMLEKFEDALVECRRVNHKLHLMISQGKRKYKLSPMAAYLSAMIYEARGELNDAYVDYQQVYKLKPEFRAVGEDLYRLATSLRIADQAENWAREFGLTQDQQKQIRSSSRNHEIVLIIENGRAPEKHPHPNWAAIPHFVPRYNPVHLVDVQVDDSSPRKSESLYNVEAVAIQNLDEKFAGLLAKRIAGVVVKEVIADQVGRRTDPIIGAVLRLGMHAADQADLRSWLTLPRDFQVFRFRVGAAGAHRIRLQARSLSGDAVGDAIEKIVQVPDQKTPQKVFVPLRLLH